MSTKRTNNGEEKTMEFSDEHIASIDEAHNAIERLEFAAERERQKLMVPGRQKRDQILDSIPGFWRAALKNSLMYLQVASFEEDAKALEFLTKIRGHRAAEHPKAFGIELHFDPNPFFSNSVLKKEFRYVAPSDPEALKKDEYGVCQADIDFDFDRDVDVVTTKIEWKEDKKNLSKLFPRVYDPEEPEEVVEDGSFFNLFDDSKVRDLNESNILDIYEEATNYFRNKGEGTIGGALLDDEEEEDDDDDDADDSDADEIDLENPKKKAKK